MYLQSVTSTLVLVFVACAGGQTVQTGASSASATTTSATATSSSRFDSLSGKLIDEISAYFAQLLPSATASPTPLEINEPLDIIIDGRIYPPVIYDGGVPVHQDISIDCTKCNIFGNASLSGGGKIPDDPFPGSQLPTPADVLELRPDFNFTGLWVGATFDELSAHFNFNVILNASNGTNEFIVSLPSKTFSKSLGDLSITATLDPELYGSVNTTNDVNFTYGFDFNVPSGSELLLPLESLNKSISVGFNESTLTPAPFTSPTKNLNLNLDLSFRPTITFVASIGGLPVSVQVSVTLDVPKLSAQISQVHNVTASCDPAPPSLPADQTYQNLTLVVPTTSVDALEVFQEALNLKLLSPGDTQPFQQGYEGQRLPTACYAFSKAGKTLVAAAVSKPGDTSGGRSGRVVGSEVLFLGLVVVMVMVVFVAM